MHVCRRILPVFGVICLVLGGVARCQGQDVAVEKEGKSGGSVASLTSMVVPVKPSNPILHGLEVKTGLDRERRWVSLRGPEFYSSPKDAEEKSPAFMNWYAVRKPKDEAAKSVRLVDGFSAGETFELKLGKPLYYLIPAQTITDGPPSEIPAKLDHFLAFEIINSDDLGLPHSVPGKPAMVCVPAEEWHHADHAPIKNPKGWLMVYRLQQGVSESEQKKITTIDQFGLNGLKAKAGCWLYVPAQPQP